ncbi:MAG: hypothetical protein ACK57K_05440 [Chryseotalea sp.]
MGVPQHLRVGAALFATPLAWLLSLTHGFPSIVVCKIKMADLLIDNSNIYSSINLSINNKKKYKHPLGMKKILTE